MAENRFLRTPIEQLSQGLSAIPQVSPLKKPEQMKGAPIESVAPRRVNTGSLMPPDDLMPAFEHASAEYGVPVNILAALAQQESNYRHDAVGVETKWGRAKGMFQYIDPTANSLGINPFDTKQSMGAAAKQFKERIDKGYSVEEAIMAHHGGDDRRQWGPKTKRYVSEVLQKADAIGQGFSQKVKPIEAFDLNAIQAELDAKEPGRYKVLAPGQEPPAMLTPDAQRNVAEGGITPLDAANAANALAPAGQPAAGKDGFTDATGKALRNIPENFKNATGGLIRYVGEDLGATKERSIAIAANRLGITPEEAKLVYWAESNGLISDDLKAGGTREMVDALKARHVDVDTQTTFEHAGIVDAKAIADKGAEMSQQAKSDMIEINPDGPMAKYGSMIIGSTAEMVPALVAGVVTRNPNVTLGLIGGQVYGQSYDRARTDKDNAMQPREAAAYALSQAVAEAIPSALPVHVILKPGGNFFAGVLKAGAAEALQEGVTAALQAGIDKGTIDPNMTWEQAREQIVDGMIVGAGAGMTLKTGVEGTRAGINAMRGGETPSAAPSSTTPPAEADTTPAAEVPEQIDAAPVQEAAAEEAAIPEAPAAQNPTADMDAGGTPAPSGPLGRAAATVTQQANEPVTLESADGAMTGVLESYVDQGNGRWTARVRTEDGNSYDFTHEDGVNIVRGAQPLAQAADQVIEQEAEAVGETAVEESVEQPAAVAVEPMINAPQAGKRDEPAVEAPPAEVPKLSESIKEEADINQMDEPALRAELKAVAKQAKQLKITKDSPVEARDERARLTARRKEIERRINGLMSEPAKPVTAMKEMAEKQKKIEPTNSLQGDPASWVIREKATGDVVMETFDRKKVDALNTEKYEAVAIQQHLGEVNQKIKAGEQATVKETLTAEQEKAAKPAEIKGVAGKRDKIVTPAGREVDVEYRVVEADDLITSNTDGGTVNPNYPQALQPRDRTRASSEMQIQEIASKLNPRLLSESPTSSDGAPIVSPDGVVESGNGRTLAVRRAYQRSMESAEQYKKFLAEQGYDVASMKRPVLVRVRQSEMTEQDLVDYTRESNDRTTLSMSATERAMADSKGVMPIVTDFAGGDLAAAANRDFVRGFIDSVVAKSDRAGMMDGTGQLSQEGRRRIEGALLAAAYGDQSIVSDLMESTDTDIKAIGGALLDAAGSWAQMRQATEAESIQPGLDVTPNLIEAVNLVRRARAEGKKVFELVNQTDIFAGDLDPVTKGFVSVFYRGESFTRARGRDKVADALQSYASQALRTQPGDTLFGDALPPAKPNDLLEQANARNIQDETQRANQQDIFAAGQGSNAERAGRTGGEGQRQGTGAESGPGARFSVAAAEKNLITAHNLSADNLRHVLEIGGMPAPSLAITKANAPIQGFGEITLIGDAALATPSTKNPVFDADVYSPRFPDVKVKVDEKRVKAALDPLVAAARDAGVYVAEPSRLIEELQRNQLGRAVGDVAYDLGLRYGYLTQVKGETVDIPTKTEIASAPAASGRSVIAYQPLAGVLETVDVGKVTADSQESKAIADALYSAMINRFSDQAKASGKSGEDASVSAVRMANKTIRGFAEVDKDNPDAIPFADDVMFNPPVRMTLEGLGKINNLTRNTPAEQREIANERKVIDTAALSKMLNERVDDTEIRAWAREQLAPAMGEKRIVKEGGRTAEYSLENLTKEMTRKVRDAEGFNYGLGNARSRGATQFRNLKQVQGQRDRVVGKDDADAAFEENKQAFDAILEELVPFHPASKERYGRSAWSALPDVIGESYSIGMDRALKENGFVDVPAALVERVKQFASDLVQLPTEYFEAKPKRAVKLDEFAGAVVPSNLPQELRQSLIDAGLEVAEYERGSESSRAQAVDKLSSDMHEKRGDIRYSVQDGDVQAEFGPVLKEKDAAKAIGKLMQQQTGEAIITKDGIGDISIVYGNDNLGLAHIARRRGERILQRLPDLIEKGEVYTRPGQIGRVFIGNGRDEAVIRLDWNGSAKTWLVSAYEKHPDLTVAEAPQQGRRSQIVRDRTAEPMTADQVQQAISKGAFGMVVGDMVRKGIITIHKSSMTLPEGMGRGKRGVQAVTAENGNIHLVANNLTPANARAVLYHEMFHSGVEGLVGSKRWGELIGRLGSMRRQAASSKGRAGELMRRAEARVQSAKAQGAVSTRMENEEFGAYLIEEYESLPASFKKWVDDFIGMLKAWIYKRYGKQIGRVTPAQLRGLAKDALINIALRRRGEMYGRIGTLFSSQGMTAPADAETGKPMTVHFARNTVSSKGMAPAGMDFGQKIEPAGEYMVIQDSDMSGAKNDGWEYGVVSFDNPLVLEHKDTTSNGWKKDLSEMFGGKTGKALSAAVKAAGHDGIVTRDKYGYSETVNLDGKKGQSKLDRALAMTEDEYIAAINPDGKRGEDDDVIVRLGDLDLPKDAKRIGQFLDKDGRNVKLMESAEGMHAVQGDNVLGEVTGDGSETVLLVVEEARGKGIGKSLMKEYLRKHPLAKAGSLSTAGEATARAAFRELKKEPRFSVKPSEVFTDLTDKQKSFLDKIGPEQLPARLRDRWTQITENLGLRIRQAGVDRYAALLRNDQALLGEDTLEGSIASSAWVLARMSHAAGGAVTALMNSGRIYLDPKEKVIDIREGSKGLAATLRQLGTPAEIDRFMGWIAANRAKGLMEQGRENLFTPSEIEAGIKLSGGKLQSGKSRSMLYAKVWKEFQQYRDDVLGIAEQTGLLKPAMSETDATMLIARKYDAPEKILKQLQAGKDAVNGATTEDMLTPAQEKFAAAQDALMDWIEQSTTSAQGDALARPPIESIRKELADLQRSQRELWAEEFYVPFYRVMDEDSISGPSFGGTSGLSRQQAYKKLKGGKQNLNDLLMNTLMNYHNLIQASLKNQAAMQAVENAEKLGIAEKTTENGRDKKLSTFVLENGEKQWYDISDPLTFKALAAIGNAGLNNTSMKIGRAFKRFFTNMTTITPQFVIANSLRDTLSAMATSPTSMIPLANAIKGAVTYGNDHKKARMMASGAAFSFGHVYGSNPDEVKQSITGAMRKVEVLKDPMLIPSIMLKAWRAWNQVTDFAENVNRAGIWSENMDRGKLKAAFEARDLMDFSAHGDATIVRIFTDLVPFMNARIQGLDKLYRSGFKTGAKVVTGDSTKADKQAFARFMVVTGALMAASVLLYIRNHDDEEYRKLEDWQRDSYWVIRFGDNMYFIPKPFEVGAIATMGERLAEQFMDPAVGGEKFAQRLWHMLTDTFAFDLTPQAVKPIYELAKNKDGFTGRQIEDQSMQRLSPSLRSRPDTSRLADAASRGIESVLGVAGGEDAALSPVQIDHLIQGYTGAVGSTAVGLADTLWRRASGEELPARRWHEYQPIRRFYRDLTQEPAYTRYASDFYEALKKADRSYADFMHLTKYGEEKRAAELVEEKGTEINQSKALNKVARGLSEINKEMKRVQMDKTLSGEAKRLELDRLRSMRNLITEQVGKDLEQEKIRKLAGE